QSMLMASSPNETQLDKFEMVADLCYRVFDVLERMAAQGELIHQDDTSVRILALMDENLTMRAQAEARGLSRPTERTGMFTTALGVNVGERTISLDYSGGSPAG